MRQLPAGLQDERRKLYVILAGKEVWYVGEAALRHASAHATWLYRPSAPGRSMARSLAAMAATSGYLNSPRKNQHSLHVFVFDEKFDDDRVAIKAIEGELVFLIRQRTGG
jgi:hypothetical protein